MKLPKQMHYANTPTPIQKMDYLSEKLGVHFYVKRDDYTGLEMTGNKIRKLEFCMAEAKEQGCDYVITCGGIQSNHCRATAAVCAKEKLKCVIVLVKKRDAPIEGNLFLDYLLGAEIKFITPDEYENRTDIMEGIKRELQSNGHNVYIMPEGASFGIGNFGYVKCMEEIVNQEKQMGTHFDVVCCTVGSGGTLAGLLLGKKLLNASNRVCGVNIADTADYFKNKIARILEESNPYLDDKISFSKDEIEIFDGYSGKGYGIPGDEDIDFIKEIALNDGLIVDHVYNAKAMRGFVTEIQKRTFSNAQNVLYVHTGGLFGLFSIKEKFGYV